jgi:diaminopimelate decarboxylase
VKWWTPHRGPNDARVAAPAGAIDESVVLHRCSLYRKTFPWAEISYPAAVLVLESVAKRVRRRGLAVDVCTTEELDYAMLAGVHPVRIIMHRDGPSAAPIRRAVNAGVGRFVIGSTQQVAVLASCTSGPQRVLIDVTTDPADELVAAVFSQRRLNLVGLHYQLGGPSVGIADYAQVVERMIAQMAQIRRRYGVILTRLSVAGGDVLCNEVAGPRRVAEAIEDALDDGCARWRFPRPLLGLSPGLAILVPSGPGPRA